MSATIEREAATAVLAGLTTTSSSLPPHERRIEIRDANSSDADEHDECHALPNSNEPFCKVETPTRGGFRMTSGLRAPRQPIHRRRMVMFGGISTVNLPSRVDEEQEEHYEPPETVQPPRASSSMAMALTLAGHQRSSGTGPREGDARSSMESSLSSTTALLSESTQQRWFARIDPRRDLRWYSNRFRDDRLEESYQLYTSMNDLNAAQRLLLFLVFFQVLVFLWFMQLRTACVGSDTIARVNATTHDCDTYTMPEIHNELNVVLWAYVPFALLFGFFPLTFLERTMRLRIVVYYFRRTWKSIAVMILLLWSVGLDVYMHTLLFAVRSNRQRMINRGETSCGKQVAIPREWYADSLWMELHESREFMSLQYWILVYQAKTTSTIIMAVLALVATVTGIVSFAVKLDFPHVLINSGALWVTMFLVRLLGPPFSMNSRPEHTKGLTIFLMLSALLPTALTLIATYSEDRACRIAYASKVRAERMNTSLKLDLSVKRMGLENRNLPRDEKEMMEEELLNASDTRILKQVSIPFVELELNDVVAKTPNGDILLADYHGTQVVLKRLALSCCTPEGLKDFKVKVQMQAMLRHPNIVLFIGATYDNLANVGVVLEYLERGDVYSLLRSSIALSWSDPLLKIATDVALGVSYLHNCDPPLVHRDLKSLNLLCTTTYSCKISDFGESKRQAMGGSLFSTIVGTPYWLAPEILREEKYDTQVDCYSFGIVLIELETRKDPYYDRTDESTIDIMMQVARGDLCPTIPGSCMPCRRDLILRCLDTDPKRRPKMTEILHSLQNEVRQEVFDQNSFDQGRDRRRLMLMQRHQRLNRRGVKDLMHQDDSDDE